MNWPDMEAQFQDAMKGAGMTTRAAVKSRGATVVVDLTRFDRPDTRRFDGVVQSRDYAMEYAHVDLPYLAEGDLVTLVDEDDATIFAERYRVRQAPAITDNPNESRTGYYRTAILTKL